jgi:hypothetical protein
MRQSRPQPHGGQPRRASRALLEPGTSTLAFENHANRDKFVEEQAIDRVHRLNQTKDVTVYRLTIADSVEERILRLQDAKRALANAALEGGKAVAKLSMQDIMALFRHDAEHQWTPDKNPIDQRAGVLKER